MKINNPERQHYVELLDSRRRMLATLVDNAADKRKDKSGSATNAVGAAYRFIGFCEYLLDENVAAFREGLARSAACRLSLFQRFESGEPISRSYLSFINYKSLFDALASKSFDLAAALAHNMRARSSFSAEFDHPFDAAMGCLLHSVVLNEPAHSWSAVAVAELTKSEHDDFSGYVACFRAIDEKDVDVLNSGIARVCEGHQRQGKHGIFSDTIDKHVCVWGVGLINLGLHRGIPFRTNNSLLPADLVA